MIEAILAKLLQMILDYLLGKATKAVAEQLDQMAKDKKQGKIDEKNIEKYQSAKDRESRVRAVIDLLNSEP